MTLEGQILEIFSEEDLAVIDLDVEQGEEGLPQELWILAVSREEEGKISAMAARTAPESQTPRAERLKNQVGKVYDLSAEHIHISIRE